jgi:O-acetylserine/cysteine efflux transporter
MTVPHIALLIVVMILAGGNLIAMKLLVNDLPPFLAGSLRFALALVFLAPFLKMQPGRMKQLFLTTFNVGVINFGLAFLALSMAEHASSLAIIFVLGVPMATILAVVFLDEHLGIWRITGIAGSFGGVVVLGFDPNVFTYLEAMLVGLLVAVSFAVGTIQMRKLSGIKPLTYQAWLAATIVPFHLVISLVFEEGHLHAIKNISAAGIGGLIYGALLASIAAHAAYFYLLQRYPVTMVMPYTPLASVFGVGLAIIILGESVTTQMVIGGILTLIGVSLITLRNRDHALDVVEKSL